MVDERKICFVICANKEQQLQECIMYLSLLHIPDGYHTDVITVADAVSVTAGYNEAMRESDAKYKIYLHQDVFIIEHYFLDCLLKLFQEDRKIGIIGIDRNREFTGDGVLWHEKEDREFTYWSASVLCGDKTAGSGYDCKEVEAVDGLLMATQYDIPWREDLFNDSTCYDVSQCMEFKRMGYRIVIPVQGKDWVTYAGGIPDFWTYHDNRKILWREYPEIAKLKQNSKCILFIHSEDIQLHGIPFALQQLGHSVSVVYGGMTFQNDDSAVGGKQEMIEEFLEEGNYDLVITYDFWQSVSNACQAFGVPYYAWVYDDPLLELYSKEALNGVNYISVFDRRQFERLSGLGLRNLFYLPLAANIDMFGLADIDKTDEDRYSCDISFVGRLYNNRGFEQTFGENGREYLEEAKDVMEQMDCRWNADTTIFGKASEDLTQYMIQREPKDTWETWNIDKRYYCESMILARKCNEIERIRILETLQNRFSVVLYADESAKQIIKGITVRPQVDYSSEMPKVFYLSKINLNITSRSIESGIPQRVWDIMAAGGFCLTNYQPELEEYFEIGKELEVYHNLEELVEKTAYYLTHEEERVRVAINGYKKVREEHDIKLRLQKALDHIQWN